MNKVQSLLNSLAVSLEDNFNNLNRGGCGVIASLVGKELSKLKYVHKVKIVNVSDEYFDIDDIRPRICNNTTGEWYQNAPEAIFYHLMLSFTYRGKEYLFDTMDMCILREHFENDGDNYGDTVIAAGGWSVGEMEELVVDNGEGWNDSFDRYSIPAIKQMIIEHFEQHS